MVSEQYIAGTTWCATAADITDECGWIKKTKISTLDGRPSLVLFTFAFHPDFTSLNLWENNKLSILVIIPFL